MSTTITIRSSLLREALACSCGCFKPHAFATRETADGRRVRLWTDGTTSLPLTPSTMSGPPVFSRRSMRQRRLSAKGATEA